MRTTIAILSMLPLLTACGDDPPKTALPVFDDAQLTQGRNTWMQVCRNCHLTGVAGAPAITDATAWQPRLVKGKATLYQNAINGIPQASGWSMPPRGGEARLSDEQVRRAVDYMLAAQAKVAEQKRR
jgi:cytochrome c5